MFEHFEEVIAYGVEKGAFPPGDLDLKAHCLLVLAQSWAVRRWALKRFAKVDDYLAALKSVALGLVESETAHSSANGAARLAAVQETEPVQQLRGTLP